MEPSEPSPVHQLLRALRDWQAYCDLPVEIFYLGIMLITGGHRRFSIADCAAEDSLKSHLGYLTTEMGLEESFIVGAIAKWAEVILEQLSQDWPKFRHTASPWFHMFQQHPREFLQAFRDVSGASLPAAEEDVSQAMGDLVKLLDQPPTQSQLRTLVEAHNAWQIVARDLYSSFQGSVAP